MSGSKSSPDTSSTMSRREFLGAVGTAAVAGGLMTSPAQAATLESSPSPPSPPSPKIDNIQPPTPVATPEGFASLSPMGREKIRDINRRHAQQRQQNGTGNGGKSHEFDREINAVKDLGLDPTGEQRIDAILASADLNNARVFFPKGTYRMSSKITIHTDAPCALVGPEATLVMDPGARGHLKPIIPGGLIKGLTLSMRAKGALIGLQPMTDGYIEVIDVDIVGYAAPIPETQNTFSAIYVPIAKNSGASIRTVGLSAVGGTAADMHEDESGPNAPESRMRTYPGVGVWKQNKGTIQLIDCKIRGWQNGLYGARHPGEMHIFGGLWWNNSNCQIRIGGGSFVDRTKMVIDARKWSMKRNPGPYYLGEQQGVNGVRIEAANGGVMDEPVHLRNIKIIGKAVETIGALINPEGTSPMTKVKNSVIANHLGPDVPALLAAKPGSQFNYPAAPNPTVQVEDCIFKGKNKMDPAIEAHDRPGRVIGTCFVYPDAGPEDIVGLDIGKNVSFGKCGPQSGLSAPEKVAESKPVSQIPIPTNPNYSGPGGGGGGGSGGGLGKRIIVAVIGGIFILLFILFGGILMFAAGIVGAFSALAAMIRGD